MTQSAEIRWFFKGIVNNDILLFFKENNIVFKEETPRTDWYLLNNDRFTSIKLRNGNLEIKRYMRSFENFQVVPEVRGNIERWDKFTFSLSNSSDASEITSGKHQGWCKVDKARSTARYEILSNGKFVPVQEDKRLQEYCILEICFIKALNNDWWTICFEASGSESTIQFNLENVTRQILQNSKGISILRTENSYSYPEFLAKLNLLAS